MWGLMLLILNRIYEQCFVPWWNMGRCAFSLAPQPPSPCHGRTLLHLTAKPENTQGCTDSSTCFGFVSRYFRHETRKPETREGDFMEEILSSTQPPPIVVGTGDRRESALPVEETSERISVSSAPSLGVGILQRDWWGDLGGNVMPTDNLEFPTGSEVRSGQSLRQKDHHL